MTIIVYLLNSNFVDLLGEIIFTLWKVATISKQLLFDDNIASCFKTLRYVISYPAYQFDTTCSVGITK